MYRLYATVKMTKFCMKKKRTKRSLGDQILSDWKLCCRQSFEATTTCSISFCMHCIWVRSGRRSCFWCSHSLSHSTFFILLHPICTPKNDYPDCSHRNNIIQWMKRCTVLLYSIYMKAIANMQIDYTAARTYKLTLLCNCQM